jgi:hypothetical protein
MLGDTLVIKTVDKKKKKKKMVRRIC